MYTFHKNVQIGLQHLSIAQYCHFSIKIATILSDNLGSCSKTINGSCWGGGGVLEGGGDFI